MKAAESGAFSIWLCVRVSSLLSMARKDCMVDWVGMYGRSAKHGMAEARPCGWVSG
jgi:hypothetical protein